MTLQKWQLKLQVIIGEVDGTWEDPRINDLIPLTSPWSELEFSPFHYFTVNAVGKITDLIFCLGCIVCGVGGRYPRLLWGRTLL